MIRITVNVDGSNAWIFKRIECMFRGHEWCQSYRISKQGQSRHEFLSCFRCRKVAP